MSLATFPFWLEFQNQGLGCAQDHRLQRLCMCTLKANTHGSWAKPTPVVWEGQLRKIRRCRLGIRTLTGVHTSSKFVNLVRHSCQVPVAITDWNSTSRKAVLLGLSVLLSLRVPEMTCVRDFEMTPWAEQGGWTVCVWRRRLMPEQERQKGLLRRKRHGTTYLFDSFI